MNGSSIALAAGAYARRTRPFRNKLDLTMGIAVGSSIQIALFVAPALLLSSYCIAPRPFDLVVGNAPS